MTWIISLLSGILGSAIGCIVTLYTNSKANRTQVSLFEKQRLNSEKDAKQAVLSRKKEAALILYNLIPEIAWEGFQIKKGAINFPSIIYSNVDYNSTLNVLRDEFEKKEILYLVKLFANIEATKRLNSNTNDFKNSYDNLLRGFCNGYVNCGVYYSANFHKGTNSAYEEINKWEPDSLTKDIMIDTTYSDFIDKSENCIYTKLFKIIESGTAKAI